MSASSEQIYEFILNENNLVSLGLRAGIASDNLLSSPLCPSHRTSHSPNLTARTYENVSIEAVSLDRPTQHLLQRQMERAITDDEIREIKKVSLSALPPSVQLHLIPHTHTPLIRHHIYKKKSTAEKNQTNWAARATGSRVTNSAPQATT